MISGEAPVLFAKAAELFIAELSLRSWIHTEDNKRRTLQRNDIAMAITKYDQFDFLIDIVPREELQKSQAQNQSQISDGSGTIRFATELPANAQIITPIDAVPIETMTSDQLQAYLQMAQQHQQMQQSMNGDGTTTTFEISPNQSTTTVTPTIINDGTTFTT